MWVQISMVKHLLQPNQYNTHAKNLAVMPFGYSEEIHGLCFDCNKRDEFLG